MKESDWAVRRDHRPRLTFDAFCETHERAWAGFARTWLWDLTAAARVVEEMKEHLWRNWPTALREPVPAFEAWMLIKEHVRKEMRVAAALNTGPGRRQEAVPEWVDEVRDSVCPVETGRAGAGPPGAVAGGGEDGRRRFHEQICALSERRRDVIILRYHLGLTYRVIAEYLGITEAGARSAAEQAGEALARRLGSRQEGEQ
ncbi:RNA polymerase sigma factor [Streptomyces sp. NPDC088725]|uniref:RNA polymerase sigma factor n=1 Tax=Streptomyces sp. NPDC088725 TaxID=3365873 RepID=UPI00382B3564